MSFHWSSQATAMSLTSDRPPPPHDGRKIQTALVVCKIKIYMYAMQEINIYPLILQELT